MYIHMKSWVIAVLLTSCVSSQPPPQGPPTGEPAKGERRTLTQAECDAQGGSIVGDIGDGATHRSDYVCSSGKPALGDIAQPEGGPIAIEGSVCCPR